MKIQALWRGISQFKPYFKIGWQLEEASRGVLCAQLLLFLSIRLFPPKQVATQSYLEGRER